MHLLRNDKQVMKTKVILTIFCFQWNSECICAKAYYLTFLHLADGVIQKVGGITEGVKRVKLLVQKNVHHSEKQNLSIAVWIPDIVVFLIKPAYFQMQNNVDACSERN
jgi:hypothetical protein